MMTTETSDGTSAVVLSEPGDTTTSLSLYDQFYQEDIDIVRAVDTDTLLKPYMPMDYYIGEAEALLRVIDRFQDTLVNYGFEMESVELLKRRIGSCRVAQVKLDNFLGSSADNHAIWKEYGAKGFKLRNHLLETLRYACRKSEQKVTLLKSVKDGGSTKDMIHDLFRLGDLAENSIPELKKMKYDTTNIHQIKELSMQLAGQQEDAKLDRKISSEIRTIRDQSYTLVHLIVLEVRDLAHYIYRHDPVTLRLFLSAYSRMKSLKAKNSASENNPDEEQQLSA